jgi:menaquinone-dependent protoporphyrinogen IX oxidase
MSVTVRHPDIAVQLTGRDGNAMNIMAAVTTALRRNGHADEVDEFMAEAMSSDYDNVIRTAMRWVDVS